MTEADIISSLIKLVAFVAGHHPLGGTEAAYQCGQSPVSTDQCCLSGESTTDSKLNDRGIVFSKNSFTFVETNVCNLIG